MLAYIKDINVQLNKLRRCVAAALVVPCKVYAAQCMSIRFLLKIL
jgi:hypothetical protein